MSTLSEIQQAVRQLLPNQFAAFRTWFAEYDAQSWDEEFERDANTGKLDGLSSEALSRLSRKPGSALGKLKVLATDDEHLADVKDYMP